MVHLDGNSIFLLNFKLLKCPQWLTFLIVVAGYQSEAVHWDDTKNSKAA
jgi:hypothetical protein